MPLEGFVSLCADERQSTIVSRDKGSQRSHVANNVNRNLVAHYRIDGDVIHSNKEQKCDFLLLNEDKATAYLIELKGKSIGEAIKQLENTEKLLANELEPYHLQFRIICSKAKTHGENPEFCVNP